MTNVEIAVTLRGICATPELLAQFVREDRFEIKLGALTLRCDADRVEALADKFECPKRARAAENIQFSFERAFKALKVVGPYDWQELPKGSPAAVRKLGVEI